MAKKPQKIETPEIEPEKWSEFESTLKRALDMPHKLHAPMKGGAPKKRAPRKK
jgi:hypothetical protein